MGVLDKLLDVVKLNDDYDDEDFLDDDILDDEDDFLDDDDEEKPVKKFFQKFGKKKDEDDFLDDDEEDEIEEPVKAETKQSAPKASVKASSGQAGSYFFKDHTDEKQQKSQHSGKYGSLCDQTFFYGRYP